MLWCRYSRGLHFLLCAVVLVLPARMVRGTCNDEPSVCEPFSGECSALILAALRGEPGDSGFRYGKYCGFQTCRPVENELLLRDTENECIVGDIDCPVAPCDVVDAACQGHDTCLEAELAALGLAPDTRGGVGIPRRCQCETEFVYALSQVEANGVAGAGGSDQLCDEAFYGLPVPEPKDASVFSLIPCCGILLKNNAGDRYCAQDAAEKGYTDIYDPTVAYCEFQIGEAGAAIGGLDICGVVESSFSVEVGEGDGDLDRSSARCSTKR